MPYQPTNPYPYNMGIDLRKGLTLQFRVDNYDTIIKFEIEIYDLFKNERIYKIVREIGEIQEIEDKKELVEGDKQIIRIYDEAESLVYFNYYEGESVLPVVGGLSEDSVCKIELTNYLKTIEQIEYEKYYNTVTDFTNFEITEIMDKENEDLSYYELTKEENSNSYYISGIKKDYQDEFKELIKIVLPYKVRIQENGEYREEIVRGIGTKVFENYENLQEIILPSSIYKIGDSAFLGCYSLSKIVLNYGLTEISSSVFSDCISLNSIKLTDSIETVGENCFFNCENLKEVILSKSLDTISKKCFSNTGIEDINLRYIKTIEESAFANCENLINIKFSDELEIICKLAFDGCNSIYEIKLPNSLETIGEGAFKGCNNIIEIELPFIGTCRGEFEGENSQGYENLFGYIFGQDTKNFTIIQKKYPEEGNYYSLIPKSISKVVITNETIISYGAFYNCEELLEVQLNEGIERIEAYAFYNCYSLTDINIPESVEFIGDYVFGLENNLFEKKMEVNE